jgi:hypothetical protein
VLSAATKHQKKPSVDHLISADSQNFFVDRMTNENERGRKMSSGANSMTPEFTTTTPAL